MFVLIILFLADAIKTLSPWVREIPAPDGGTGSDIINQIKWSPMLAKAIRWLEKCTILQFILKKLNLQSLGLLKAMPIFGKQKGGPHPALGIRNHPAPSYCHPIV